MSFKITVLISGYGSNLQSLIDHCENGFWRAEINHVISNKKAAYGLERARQNDILASYLPYFSKKEPRSVYEMELLSLILSNGKPDLVVCAGWMHVLGVEFLENIQAEGIRIINLHPALPGMFPGTDGIGSAYRAFRANPFRTEKWVGVAGCMVHNVIPEIDAGKVISTFKVPIYSQDSEEDLRNRVQIAEKFCLLEAVSSIILENNKYNKS